jgi:hypothetical protein
MTDTREGGAPSPATSSLIVDLTGRIKKSGHALRARRPIKSVPASTTVYAFPARHVNPSCSEKTSPVSETAPPSRRLPRWTRSLTAWHGLIAGAIACYVLIACNLIYGLSTMAQLKVWRPLQGATMSEFQRRALTTPAECERSQQTSASGVAGVPLASVLCSADKSFTDALDELFPRGTLVREPRTLRVH